jgi:hypothetical protein
VVYKWHRVAVDFEASVGRAFSLADLLARADAVTPELLGGAEGPPLTVVLDRKRVMGQVGAPGRVAGERELRDVRLGPRRLTLRSRPVIDVLEEGEELVGVLESPGRDDWRVVFMPRRDAVGLVRGLTFAIAAAIEGHGTVIAHDVPLVEPPIGAPLDLVAATRLPPGRRSFADACREYLNQFPGTRERR